MIDHPDRQNFAELFGSGDVPGYLTEGDCDAIYSLTTMLPSEGIVVEIGSFLGKSAVEWAKNFENLDKAYKILCVESFNSPVEILHDLLVSADFVVPEQGSSQLEMFNYYTRKYENIIPVYGFFNKSFVFPTEVDLVFEDSTHEFHYLSYALPFWWKAIKPGGILSGHDYDDEVKTAVDLFAALHNVEVNTFGDSSIWYIVK
jgi:hypothetical protein